MTQIERTELPGVGIRYEFVTADGGRLGVILHRTGRREIFVCEPADPDTVSVAVDLSEDEAHSLIDVLGGSQVVTHLGDLQQHIKGLAIDWLPIEAGSAAADHTIGDTRMRRRTGVSIVAVLRQDQPVPAPGPEFMIKLGDTLVVVGTPGGIEAATGILQSG